MARDNNPQGASPFSFGSSGSAHVPGQTQASAPTQGVAESSGHGGNDPFGVKPQGSRRQGGNAGGDALFAPPSKQQENPGEAYGYRKSLFGHKDEVSVYTAQMDARHAIDPRIRAIIIAAVLTIVCIPLFVVLPKGLFGSGMAALSPATFFESLGSNITGLINWIAGGPVTTGVSILFWQVAAIAFIGAALAVNGCVYQSALNNALASPSTLGVMSGATLGTLVYTLTFGIPETAEIFTVVRASELQRQLDSMDLPTYLFATQGRALCSLVGCFAVVALILLISYIAGRGKVSKVALLIAGQVFTALISGVIAVIRAYLMMYGTEEQRQALLGVVGGDVSSITGPVSFCMLVIPIVIGIVIIFAMRFKLNLLAFGEDDTRAMGVNAARTRNVAIIVCTALTGLVVSFVGSVGFVGFLIPHLARRVVGPDLRYLVPASMLFGSVFLLLTNYLMQATGIFAGSLGTLTSLVGAVFFLVMAVRQRARGNVDWI